MKSHILWILLLISISSYIGATSNESTTTATKFILSHPTLLKERISSQTSNDDDDDNSSGILMRENTISSAKNTSFATRAENSMQANNKKTSAVNVSWEMSYSENINNKPLKYNKYLPSSDRGGTGKAKRSTDTDISVECEPFTIGDEATKTFYSPGGKDKGYTKNITCIRVIEAPQGYLVKLDFRDYFQMEPSEDCKFDMLEVRDGAHGFANILGTLCGHHFPDIIRSNDRFLWLRFTSDENIEERGFKAVYEFIPRPTSVIFDETDCTIRKDGFEGWINSTEIGEVFPQKVENIMKLNLPLDCMFIIEVEESWKILLSFVDFTLKKPNECSTNFIDVFPEQTDLRNRLKNFCGSIADTVGSKTNIIHIRYYAEPSAINSTFAILYTAIREKANQNENCKDDEFDCDDQNCVKKELECNGFANCRFKSDEHDKCPNGQKEESDHIRIVLIVFGVIMTFLAIAFLVNCTRKIMRDHKIIREHIRQSRESKLDELGRHSTKLTKSRENIAMAQLTKIPPPAFDLDSPSSINLIDNNATTHPYYRDVMSTNNGARIIDSKNDLNLREQEIKNILGTSYVHDDERKEMEDVREMACQTRESLFQPVFKNKVTQSPLPGGLRFSTFGYLDNSTPSPPPPPSMHHQQFVASATMPCPTHSQSSVKTHTLPHQHHQHLHSHHHSHRMHSSSSTNQSSHDGNDKSTNTMGRMDEHRALDNDDVHKKIPLKKDDSHSRSYSDVRKSAPDVVIISGCTSSH